MSKISSFAFCKLAILLSAILLNCTTSNAQNKINLDEGWKFRLGNSSDSEKDFDYSKISLFAKSNVYATTVVNPKYNDTAWASINVPHDWVVGLPFENSPLSEIEAHGYKPVGGMFPQNSIGWYRKHFKVDKTEVNKRFEIQFDGIYRNATVWLNGFYVGTNFSGYVGKSYDITDYINFETENVIVVRVDATQNEGWFYEGAGIYRHVWLNTTEKLHIPEDGLYVSSELKEKNATVTIETTIQNNDFTSENCTVYSYITDRNGKFIGKTNEQKITLNANKNAIIKQKINITNSRIWSLEDPYLYKAISVIKSGNKIIQQSKTRFGIRTLKFDANEGFF